MKKKIIVGIVLTLILALAAIVIYILMNLDSVVKTAIEKFGSEATKTAVRVSSVKIKLSSGEGAVLGLTVANPPGFSSPSIITLDDISVRIDVKTVTSSPLMIDSILVSGPQIFYEVGENRTANMDILKENLAASGSSKEKMPKESTKGKGIRMVIKKLVLEKGKVHVRIAGLLDKPYTVELPRLEMTNIGTHGGAAPAEIGRAIASALAEETVKAVAASQGARLLRRGAEDIFNTHLGK